MKILTILLIGWGFALVGCDEGAPCDRRDDEFCRDNKAYWCAMGSDTWQVYEDCDDDGEVCTVDDSGSTDIASCMPAVD